MTWPAVSRYSGIAAALSLAWGGAAQAQIRTDGTLRPAVTLTGPNFAIEPSLGRQVGANLFHSFSTFNLATAERATFSGPAGITNIISRVTGGSASSIDGTIASSIAGAHLFLLNPRGILFGPNARLDLTGSFHASSADYLRFADGTRFEASAAATPVLTAAAPEAFGFFGPSAGAIGVRGSVLQPAPGQALSLVGGPIAVTDGAQISTAGGDVQLVATAGSGQVALRAASAALADRSLAAIDIDAGARIEARSSGAAGPGRILIRGGRIALANATVASRNTGSGDAGAVEIAAAGDLDLAEAEVRSSTSSAGGGAALMLSGASVRQARRSLVLSQTSGTGAGGDISLTATGALQILTTSADPYAEVIAEASAAGSPGAIAFSADSILVQSSNIYSDTRASGNAGPVSFTANTVDITDGSWVRTRSWPGPSGRAADVVLKGGTRVHVGGDDWDGFSASVFTQAFGDGRGGDIRVEAPHVDIAKAFLYSETVGAGAAGDLRFAGSRIDVVGGAIFSKTYAAGNTGSIGFEADTIRFVGGNGAITFVDTTVEGSGNGGAIDVRARGSFELSRGDYPDDWTRLSTSSFDSGNAGHISVQAPVIDIHDGASIWAGTFDSGRGGDIRLRADEVSLTRHGRIESIAEGSGRGGNIDIQASRRFYSSEVLPVPIDEHPFFGTYSYAAGSGDAGNIRIAAPQLTLLGGAVNSVTYAQGNAGTLTFEGDVIRFLGGNGNILAVGGGASNATSGNGGDVIIRARERFELNGTGYPEDWSRVGVSTQGTGASGRIDISAPDIEIVDGSLFSRTRFSTGQGGDVVLDGARIVIRTGGEVFAGTEGEGAGGAITIRASERLALDTPEAGVPSTWWPASNGSARIYASTSGTGAAGKVTIQTPELFGNNGARIVSTTIGAGDAGAIDITADRVKLTGYSSIDTSSESSGNAGSITLHVRESFEMTERTPGGAFGPRAHGIDFREQPAIWRGGIASRALGTGDAGNVFVSAPSILLDDARILTSTWQSGSGGHTEIEARQLVLRNGAQIDAKSLPGSTGDAGSIFITAEQGVEIAGMSPVDGAFSGVNAETLGSGAGGTIRISAPELLVARGFIRSSTGGSGAAGSIELRHRHVRVQDGGLIDAGTAKGSTGAGGAIRIEASESISIRGIDATPPIAVDEPPQAAAEFSGLTVGRPQGALASTVSSRTEGSGAGGNITLFAGRETIDGRVEAAGRIEIAAGAALSASADIGATGSITLYSTDAITISDAAVTTRAASTDGGNITLEAKRMIRISDADISTSVAGGAGQGGNIVIDPRFVLVESSRLSADAVGGPGGNVSLAARVYLASHDSSLSASSQLGVPGTVQVSAQHADAIAGLAALPAQFFDASGLLREACGRGAAASRLVDTGRGGVEAPLAGYVPSRYFGEPVDVADPVAAGALPARAAAAGAQSALLAGICRS